MAARRFDPRKRRTREHVIASESANYVERFIVECGFSFEWFRHDYGYDLAMFTYDEDGYIEESQVFIQLKATESLEIADAGVVCLVDVRDYSLWANEPMPVFLVVYDAIQKRAF